jgi:hypothetical protein
VAEENLTSAATGAGAKVIVTFLVNLQAAITGLRNGLLQRGVCKKFDGITLNLTF